MLYHARKEAEDVNTQRNGGIQTASVSSNDLRRDERRTVDRYPVPNERTYDKRKVTFIPRRTGSERVTGPNCADLEICEHKWLIWYDELAEETTCGETDMPQSTMNKK